MCICYCWGRMRIVPVRYSINQLKPEVDEQKWIPVTMAVCALSLSFSLSWFRFTGTAALSWGFGMITGGATTVDVVCCGWWSPLSTLIDTSALGNTWEDNFARGYFYSASVKELCAHWAHHFIFSFITRQQNFKLVHRAYADDKLNSAETRNVTKCD